MTNINKLETAQQCSLFNCMEQESLRRPRAMPAGRQENGDLVYVNEIPASAGMTEQSAGMTDAIDTYIVCGCEDVVMYGLGFAQKTKTQALEFRLARLQNEANDWGKRGFAVKEASTRMEMGGLLMNLERYSAAAKEFEKVASCNEASQDLRIRAYEGQLKAYELLFDISSELGVYDRFAEFYTTVVRDPYKMLDILFRKVERLENAKVLPGELMASYRKAEQYARIMLKDELPKVDRALRIGYESRDERRIERAERYLLENKRQLNDLRNKYVSLVKRYSKALCLAGDTVQAQNVLKVAIVGVLKENESVDMMIGYDIRDLEQFAEGLTGVEGLENGTIKQVPAAKKKNMAQISQQLDMAWDAFNGLFRDGVLLDQRSESGALLKKLDVVVSMMRKTLVDGVPESVKGRAAELELKIEEARSKLNPPDRPEPKRIFDIRTKVRPVK